jgi:hypothetical protein
MPHALFLGSSLATQDRVSGSPLPTSFSFPFRSANHPSSNEPDTTLDKEQKIAKKVAEDLHEQEEEQEPPRGSILGRIFYVRRLSRTPNQRNAGLAVEKGKSISHDGAPIPASTSTTTSALPTDASPSVAPLDVDATAPQGDAKTPFWFTHKSHTNNSLGFIKAHLNHAIVDIVMSLFGLAVVINSAWVTCHFI